MNTPRTPSRPAPTDAADPRLGGWRLRQTYAALPAVFHVAVQPTPVRAPRLVWFNQPLAIALGLDASALMKPEAGALFAGNQLPEGATPIAQAYAGHQFGHFTMLGDGRALLIGEQITPDGRHVDLQFKGSGRTPFSRRGDGRAALGPMLRELVMGEAMHALGIPTTRALAVTLTGEPVQRERALPGAVLTRVASSHLRVGTLEYAAALQDPALLRALADYAIARHAPHLAQASNPYLAWLRHAVELQAALIAKWMAVGFIHGVMNTDNMALSGETLDYGPCAFMDQYHPETVFSAIDEQGRYAFAHQPAIAQWNLARFAEALLPLLDRVPEQAIALANAEIARFVSCYEDDWLAGMRLKLGLIGEEAHDLALVRDLLAAMQQDAADFTLTFRNLIAAVDAAKWPDGQMAIAAWLPRWLQRIHAQAGGAEVAKKQLRAANPAVIPRNHQVERALQAAEEQEDTRPLAALLQALRTPFDEPEDHPELMNPPLAHERVMQTFCGT